MLDVGGERDDKDDGDGDGDDDGLLALHGLWAMEAFAWRNPFKQHCHLGDISAHIEQYLHKVYWTEQYKLNIAHLSNCVVLCFAHM